MATKATAKIGLKLARNDFCDPEAIALYLSCKALLDEYMSEEDEFMLKRAESINSGIIKSIFRDLLSGISKEELRPKNG